MFHWYLEVLEGQYMWFRFNLSVHGLVHLGERPGSQNTGEKKTGYLMPEKLRENYMYPLVN